MAITFDKEALKKYKKWTKEGKKKYAIRIAFRGSLFQTVFISIFLYFINNDDIPIIKFLLLLPLFFIFNFVTGYYIYLKDWKRIKNDYEETIEYFNKTNPGYIEDIMQTKETDDK